MTKLVWLFPGQATQAVGMGRELYESSPAARRILDLADETLAQSLTRLMFEGPAEELQLTINAQPAIVAVSLAALAALREAWDEAAPGPWPEPVAVAGHSVGEYSALVASGAADEVTGLRLIRERARLMHAAGQERPGGMVVVLGLERDAVEAACREARQQVEGSYVALANLNAATQVTIAGDAEGLAVASQACLAAGARRCVPLAVSAAFHSAAMLPAAEPLARAVAAAEIGRARIPLVGNVTARPLVAPAELRQELASQVARPVLWADSVQHMVDIGVTVFLEFGPGQVLTNLVQRLDQGLQARAIGDAAAARATVPWLLECVERHQPDVV
ncbi:MAG TPA: ACP S-malonyltransferase [Chloroflexota bacterium]|nr:ACP S-malonyltransferase [Chloroflexota bacterium]